MWQSFNSKNLSSSVQKLVKLVWLRKTTVKRTMIICTDIFTHNNTPMKLMRIIVSRTAFGFRESNIPHRSHADTNLYKVATRVWTFDECQHLYSEQTFATKHFHVLDHDFQFCFRILEGDYSAQGRYIGGPVLTKGTNKLIGIISRHIDGLPQVCTFLPAYREFINNPKVSPKWQSCNEIIKLTKFFYIVW